MEDKTYTQTEIYNKIAELIDIEKEKLKEIKIVDDLTSREASWHFGRKTLLEELLFTF
jgi:hypothetical protein